MVATASGASCGSMVDAAHWMGSSERSRPGVGARACVHPIQDGRDVCLRGPRGVSVFFGPYSGNRGEVELINPLNAAGQSGVWTLLRSGTREATIGGKSVVVMEHTIARGPQRRLVWFWYSIGDMLTSNPYRLRGMQAGERLLGHPQSPALYAVSAPFRSEPAEAGNSLTSFLK